MKDLFDLVTDKEIVFEEAVKFFGEKIPVTASVFYRLAEQYRSLAFTVAGYTKAQILKKFQEELLKAIQDGTTMAAFKANMNEFLNDQGYDGLTNFRADNIFRTNIQTAYQVGHYEQITSPEVMKQRPYWRYDAVNDRRTRPSHLAMNGRVFRADSPVWDTWYPPNGFRCRCGVETLSERELKARGLTVEDEAPTAAEVGGRFVNILPDPEFTTNPAKVRWTPDLKDYPPSLRRAFEKREMENRP